jgi:nitroimidazol reductase NimA-like FMN-containing flavoprotein (pyridoxamine 5'-phosphate oxidase superfamily)
MTQHKTMHELSSTECLRLLGAHTLGRLALMDHVGVLPMIMPVNYVLYDELITFRTDAGSKLAAAVRGEPVAFEVDGLDETHKIGWSVVVRGHAEAVADVAALAGLRGAALQPWAPGTKPHYVRIQPRRVSGRRISLPQIPANWWG